MRIGDGLQSLHGGRPSKASRWRFFPQAVIAAMAVVMAVNGGMIYAALHTFPGQAGSDGFDLSNHYDHVLAAVQRQAALGWTVQAEADQHHHPVLVLGQRGQVPLVGALVHATAQRPLGPEHATDLAFREVAPGRYTADTALPRLGQWDLLLSVERGGHVVTTTRRIVLR